MKTNKSDLVYKVLVKHLFVEKKKLIFYSANVHETLLILLCVLELIKNSTEPTYQTVH